MTATAAQRHVSFDAPASAAPGPGELPAGMILLAVGDPLLGGSTLAIAAVFLFQAWRALRDPGE